MGKNKVLNSSINTHHIIGRCNHAWAKVESDTNKVLVKVLQHQALNTLCNDKQSPQEQLAILFHEWWKPVLSEQVCHEIEYLLNMEKSDFYSSELIKWTKTKKKSDSK